MPVTSSDLVTRCPVNTPGDDASTCDGAIDVTMEFVFTQLTTNDTIEALSDGADTRNITIRARKPDGSIISETKALTGATPIAFSTLGTVERVLSAVLASTSGTRAVTVRRATGPVAIKTIAVNMAGFRVMFEDSTSDPSVQKVRYEGTYWKNTNGTKALTNAKDRITVGGDPSSTMRVGLALAKGDVGTRANRLAVPAGITFVDDGVDQTVPSSPTNGVLGSAEYIYAYLEQTLAAGQSPIALSDSYVTLQLGGSSN